MKTKEQQQFDIRRDAVIVRLNVGRYTARVRSKTLIREASEKHHASAEAIEALVRTLTHEDVAEIDAVVNAARKAWHALSLPWEDEGRRLVPTKNYNALARALEEYGNQFHDLVKTKIINRWDELVKQAKQRLNSLAADVDWPTKENIASRYYWNVLVDPVTGGTDIRLSHVNDEAAQQIERDVKERIERTVVEAQNDVALRLAELMEAITNRLSETKATFRDSLIGNVRKAMEVLPSLNILGDEKLSALIERVNKTIASVEPEAIRDNAEVKKQVLKEAKSVLDELSAFGAGGAR